MSEFQFLKYYGKKGVSFEVQSKKQDNTCVACKMIEAMGNMKADNPDDACFLSTFEVSRTFSALETGVDIGGTRNITPRKN